MGASVEVKCGLTDVGTTWRRGEWALDGTAGEHQIAAFPAPGCAAAAAAASGGKRAGRAGAWRGQGAQG